MRGGGPALAALRLTGMVAANVPVSEGLIRLDVSLPQNLNFLPGQFAMVNLEGPQAWVFGRPLSILAGGDAVVSFLYRIVGRGTAALAACRPGAPLSVLGPLGRPFPEDMDDGEAILIAGGVGLPPLFAWAERHGGSPLRGFFGSRAVADVPWPLLDDPWQVAVEEDPGDHAPAVHRGLVTELVEFVCPPSPADQSRIVLACGPWPMLKAVHLLARRRRWRCWLSLEEHMGCGYGVCKGCVVPVLAETTGSGEGWRPATCCQEGPIFPSEALDWSRIK